MTAWTMKSINFIITRIIAKHIIFLVSMIVNKICIYLVRVVKGVNMTCDLAFSFFFCVKQK